jgi:hypothetical protein
LTTKTEYFKNELAYIKNVKIKEFAEKVIDSLPDYIFLIPASSTGKYHPSYSLGEGGLVRHVRAAARIAVELARLDWWHFTSDELDLCLAAILIHDGYKSGVVPENYTRADHPNILRNELTKNPEVNSILPDEQFDSLLGMVATHMGQWAFDYKSGEKILDTPKTKFEKFVHLCDYLASRKCLTMEFEVDVKRDGS